MTEREMPCMGQTRCSPSYNLLVTIHNKKQYYIKEIEENFTVANLATDFFSQSPNPNSQSPLATIRSPMSSPAIANRMRFSSKVYPLSIADQDIK